jgi:hypothetical protein
VNKSDWKTTAELIGIAAIVVSLVFVGLQVRQEYRATDAQRDTDFNTSQIEIANLITENDALWRKGLAGEELTPEEETSFEAIVHVVDSKYAAMMSRSENLGGRPVGDIARQYAMHIFSHPGFRRVWSRRCEYYSGVRGTAIPPCVRIQAEIDAMEDGTKPVPTTKIWSL